MASTYTRKDSPFVCLRFKDAAGKWCSKKTGYRKDNIGDRRQAELLARRMTADERAARPESKAEAFDGWVEEWLHQQYEGRANATLDSYLRRWRVILRWLSAHGIHAPAQLRYAHLVEYRTDRLDEGAGQNTIIMEIKVLRIIMQEAIRRELAESNPCASLGWKREKAKEKCEWSDAEFQRVRAELEAHGPQWMLVTLLLGFYQAARLRQCAVPLTAIDLDARRVTYWRTIDGRPLTKGDKPFTQPIDKRLVPALRKIVASRIKARKPELCDLPELPSLAWRALLDRLGLKHLCHHGLRVTWITRAARSGRVPEPQARRFVNHGSQAVHQIYQKLSADDVAHVPDALDLPE